MKTIQTIAGIMGKVLNVLVVSIFLLMTSLMFAQILGRFVFKNGIFWAEELSSYSMITMVYLAAGLACKNKDHIAVTFLDEALKGNVRKIYKLIISLIGIVFLVIIAKIGFSVLPLVASQRSASMQITMNLVYMMIPIGSCIMIFYLIIEMLELLFGINNNKPEPEKTDL